MCSLRVDRIDNNYGIVVDSSETRSGWRRFSRQNLSPHQVPLPHPAIHKTASLLNMSQQCSITTQPQSR